MFSGRWDYWTRTVLNGKPLDEPIPKIHFDNCPHAEVRKNLQDCMTFADQLGLSSDGFMLLVDWILWGLNSSLVAEFPSRIPESLSWKWYTTFNMGLMLKYPADHMAWASCNLVSPRRFGNGYFPTPIHICQVMADISYTGNNGSTRSKTEKVNDPCMGTGSMLLAASNYSLRLFGQDISLDMCKMATVNGYLFMPWLVSPPLENFQWESDEEINLRQRQNAIRASQNALEAMKSLEAWQSSQNSNLTPRLEYTPKRGNLRDWF